MRGKHALLPCPAIILHTVGSSDQPARTDDGGPAHMTVTFDVEADLPGELALLCILAAHDTRRLEHAPPTVCKGRQSIWLVRACWASEGYAGLSC